jgi:2-polyprenyl-3-methyl-5-hydroxy-6-metoxy-1,4-benzoquinol methylase
MTNNDILFDNIHTKSKQLNLFRENSAVAQQLHEKFAQGERILSCPCCGSREIKFLVVKYGFQIDLCEHCSHLFTNPFPTTDALNFFYNSKFKDFENKFFIDSIEARIPIFDYRLKSLRKLLPVGARILDVGGAIGVFVEANHRRGSPFVIDVCDLSKSACDYLSSKHPNLNVINSDILQVDRGGYDCITLWDTLEHLPNPVALLDKIRSLLKSRESYFCFSTPNTRSLEWSVMEHEHVQLLPPGHVNLYNVHNIKYILGQAGFRVLSIDTPNPSLDLSYLERVLLDIEDEQARKPTVRFCKELLKFLNDKSLLNHYYEELKSERRAGNMFVVATVDQAD